VKANRLVLLAVAGAATFSLTGCAESGNHAAQVGDKVVTTSDVEFLTRLQCDSLDKASQDPAQSSQVQAAPRSRVRAEMVNALVDAALNAQIASAEHASYDRATYRQVMDQFEPVAQAAAANDRDHYRELVGGFYQGQLEVYDLAKKQLAGQGVAKPSDDEIQNAIAGIQAKYRKRFDVTINPVYGANADGQAGSQDPSLSVAVSSDAKQSVAATPSASWIAKLPARQRCG
jgi:hypothetical protein